MYQFEINAQDKIHTNELKALSLMFAARFFYNVLISSSKKETSEPTKHFFSATYVFCRFVHIIQLLSFLWIPQQQQQKQYSHSTTKQTAVYRAWKPINYTS